MSLLYLPEWQANIFTFQSKSWIIYNFNVELIIDQENIPYYNKTLDTIEFPTIQNFLRFEKNIQGFRMI